MSLEQFKAAWSRTGLLEKGYVNNTNDRGGETKYGITLAVARAHGYSGLMVAMPIEVAIDIGKEAYWDALRLDDVAALSEVVADKIFDLSFLCGQPTAALYVQRALNALSRDQHNQPMYDDLLRDYVLGKMTVYAMSVFAKTRGPAWEVVMLRALNCQEGEHFLGIADANADQREFVFGWYQNRIDETINTLQKT